MYKVIAAHLDTNAANAGNSGLRLSIREFQARQECRDQAQNTCGRTRRGEMEQACKSGFISSSHWWITALSLGSRDSTSSKAQEKGGMEFGMNKSICSQLLGRAVCG